MAADTSKFEHIWSSLMRVLGNDHRRAYQANKIILRVVTDRIRRH